MGKIYVYRKNEQWNRNAGWPDSEQLVSCGKDDGGYVFSYARPLSRAEVEAYGLTCVGEEEETP